MNYKIDKELAHSPRYSIRQMQVELCDPPLGHKASDIDDRMVEDAERALIVPATCNHIREQFVTGAMLLVCVCIECTDESCEQLFRIAHKV